MATVPTSTRQRIDISNPIITRIQVEGNDVVSFLNGTNYIRGMSQIMPQTPTYISYRYDSITISQVAGDAFTFTVYTITDVGGNTFTPLTFQDSSDVVQAKTIEIYRLLVTAIFKGCCECGNTEPECSIQYTAGNGTDAGTFLYDSGAIRVSYTTANNQDFSGLWPIIQDGSWMFVFSKTDPTVYGVYQLSNYSDGGPGIYAQFDATLLNGPGEFPAGTELCLDVTSVGGSLVQGWQDTLDIDSVLDKDNTVDGAGFNFVFDNNASFTINSGGGSVETDATGASLNAGSQQILVTAGYIDIITPAIGSASTGWVLALTAAGHVEYVEAGTGTVTSVGLDMPSAFTVTNSPITSSGDILVTGAGTALEYINGLGELATLPVYTVENGLHTKESPVDPSVFHLGGQLIEDTLIETTDGTNEYQLSVRGSANQDTRFPFGVANLGNGGVATFQDYGSGSRPNPSVEIVGDVDLAQPLLELRMEGNLPNGSFPNNTGFLSLKYEGATANNVRSSIDFEYPDSGSNMFIGGRLTTELASNVNGNERSKFDIQLIDGGVFDTKLELNGTGQLTLNEYGSGTFINGAPTYALVVDNTGLVWKKALVGGGTVTEVNATGLLTTSPDPITTTGTVTSEMNSGYLVGRYDAGVGVFQEITIGSGLTLTGDTLSADGGGGTYDSNQGVYKDTSLANDTFQLGAPSGEQSTIAFQENRFVDLGAFTFNMEGVDPAYPDAMVNMTSVAGGSGGFILNLSTPTGQGLRVDALSGVEASQKFASYFLQESDTENNVLELWRSATTPGNASDKSARISFAIPNPNTGIGYKQAGNIGYIASPENILAIQYGTAFVIEGYTLPAIDPNIRRVAQFEGDGQVIFNTYGIGTWASNLLGPAVYGLGVNSAGYVMEVPLGGSGSYLYDEGIYFIPPVNPGDPETIVLGAPSGSQSTIAFNQDRYIDTADKFLQIEGANGATGSVVLKVIEGSATPVDTKASFISATQYKKYAGSFTGHFNSGLLAHSTADGGIALEANNASSNNGLSAKFQCVNGNGIEVASALKSTFKVNSGATSSIYPAIDIENLGGVVGNGLGVSITMSPGADAFGTIDVGVSLNTVISDIGTPSGNDSVVDFRVDTLNSGTVQQHTSFIGSGQLQLHEYTTSTAFSTSSGSSVGVLNVDNTGKVFVGTGGGGGLKSGNAIQTPPASGAYEATISGVTAYTAGEAFMIKFDSTNEGASTLDINTLGPIDIFKNTDVKIAAGDIKAGQEVMVVYDGTNFQAIGLVTNQLLAYVHNSEVTPITKGQVVYAFGASGDRMSVKLALANADATSAKTIGMVYDSSIAAGGEGYIIIQGVIEGINTSTFAAGATLYLSGTIPGGYTSTPTYAPTHRVYVGIVEKSNLGNGQIYVRCQNGYELDELHDVQAQSPNDNDTLYFDSTDSQWKTASVPTILGATTVGNNLITLTNPNAITFIRVNADNTVTTRTPSQVLTDLGVAGTIILARDFAQYTAVNTTTNTLVWSSLIAANTLQVNDFIEVITQLSTNTGNGVAFNFRVYINTSASLTGATQIGIFTNTVATGNAGFLRNIAITATGVSGNLRLFNSTTSSASSYGVSAGNPSNITIDTTVGQYIIFALQMGNNTSTSGVQGTIIRLTR